MPLKEIEQRCQLFESTSIENFEEHILTSTHTRLENEYWIYSLSADRESFRMWRDYADRGRGLCVHFDATWPSPFSIAQPVTYHFVRPALPFPFPPDEEFAAIVLRAKAWRRWRYQREFRVIKYADTPFDEVGLIFQGQFGLFPPIAVTGITVGADMPPEDIDELIELVKQREEQIPVYQQARMTMPLRIG